ncbi:MAG: HAD family hydrolase [Terriglobia bacterium]
MKRAGLKFIPKHLESPHLLRAIIFDFDGIIVNSEPLILKLTQQMAAQQGWTITEDEYYHTYLALDDRGIVEHLYASHGRPLDTARRDELVAWKARAYWETIRGGLPAFPGAVDFVRKVAGEFPLAIASGSLRAEIEYLLGKLGLLDAFAALATADDVVQSKPSPEVFLKAWEMLSVAAFNPREGRAPLVARECLVIEDAPAGVEAAHAAGMKCLALAQSRPREELRHAEWVYGNFAEVDFEKIRAEFSK